MMFQPQFYGLKSVVAVYTVVNVVYKVVKRMKSYFVNNFRVILCVS